MFEPGGSPRSEAVHRRIRAYTGAGTLWVLGGVLQLVWTRHYAMGLIFLLTGVLMLANSLALARRHE